MSVPSLKDVMPDPLLVCPANAKSWIVLEDFCYKEDTTFVLVPRGFLTDFASIPRFLWQILPQWGLYGWAAVIHDYLYTSQRMPRWKADRVLLRIMAISRVPHWQRYVIYGAVWFFGCWVWMFHERKRKLEVELLEANRERDGGRNFHHQDLVSRLRREGEERSGIKRVMWVFVDISIVAAILFGDVYSAWSFVHSHSLGKWVRVLTGLALALTMIVFLLERWRSRNLNEERPTIGLKRTPDGAA